jgi:plastocyanin
MADILRAAGRALAAAYIALALGLPGAASGAGPAASVVVVGTSFSPASVVVAPGASVRWTSSGGSHNIVADDSSYTSGAPTSAIDFTHTFSAPGVYRYYCQVHGAPGGIGMSGMVVVAEPHFVYLPLVQAPRG